jgi:hypothetical protein
MGTGDVSSGLATRGDLDSCHGRVRKSLFHGGGLILVYFCISIPDFVGLYFKRCIVHQLRWFPEEKPAQQFMHTAFTNYTKLSRFNM